MREREYQLRMSSSGRALCIAALLSTAACAEEWVDPPPIDSARFLEEHRQWRQERLGLLKDPADSALSLVGLWPLKEGRTSFGSDPTSDVVLDARHAPPQAGAIVRSGNVFMLEPPASRALTLASGETVAAPMRAGTDRADEATTVVLGNLRLYVHEEPGPGYWIRVRDVADPRLPTAAATDVFEPDLRWRVAAKFEPFRTPRLLDVSDVTGGTQPREAPGMLRFRIDGRVYRVMPMGRRDAPSWKVPFNDQTNRTETFQGGRYLNVPLPDASGWTVIDFNRARNPPCAYSRYTVCELPPPENRLPLPVAAGEKRPPPQDRISR